MDKWYDEIDAKSSNLKNIISDIIYHTDLIKMLVKRDVVTYYKQTVLGPLWYFIQPLLTSLTFVFVFGGGIANISTDGVPKILFYLSGITLWNYFSESLNRTANTFRENSQIFGKVYFPRIVMPISVILSGLLKLGIQFVIFFIVLGYYIYFKKNINPNWISMGWIIPINIIILIFLSLGLGLIFTALTTKYKDLVFLLTFGVQLFMYVTPIIYPLSFVSPKLKKIISLNPLTEVLESFRSVFFGVSNINYLSLFYSFGISSFILLLGVFIFSKVESSFVDTI